MKLSEIREALKLGLPLIWNDPCPIDGIDYTINKFHNLPSFEECSDQDGEDFILLINFGRNSEAEVYPYEVLIKL